MSNIPQTPEEKFQDHINHMLWRFGDQFTFEHLNHLSIQEVNGKKELIFEEGCIILPQLRPLFKELWEECNR